MILKVSKTKGVMSVIILSIAAGLIIGVFSLHMMNPLYTQRTLEDVRLYLQNMSQYDTQKMDMFRESVLKHGKFVVFIWLLAFTPPGAFGVFILLILKSAGVGFTTALLIRLEGLAGLTTAWSLYIPQFFVLFLSYGWLAYHSILYGIAEKEKNMLGFGAKFFVSLCAVVLAAFIETYIAI